MFIFTVCRDREAVLFVLSRILKTFSSCEIFLLKIVFFKYLSHFNDFVCLLPTQKKVL